MFKDFEMWNYSFPRPHYNWCINFKLKDWSLCHMAGRRITIYCILTKKKLEDNGATVFEEILQHFFWNSSVGWQRMSYTDLNANLTNLDMHLLKQQDTFWIFFSNHLFCHLRRTSCCDFRKWILHKKKNVSFIYSPSKPVASFLFFGTWNHLFK